MNILLAAFLGVIQAATEFLPVSSTAHLLVFGELLGQSLEDERFRAFVAIIQVGTTISVIAYFRQALWEIVRAVVAGLVARDPLGTADARIGWLIALGTIPAAVAGLLLEKRIESLGNVVIAASLVVWGLVLLLAERFAKHQRTISDVGLRDAIVVGVGQALALVPGTSRSGATITTGMLGGLTREAAARFSFLLSVPITLAAGVYKLVKVLPVLRGRPDWTIATLVGTVVSLAFGYVVIDWLLHWLRTRSTYVFVAWRIAAGIVIAVLVWKGVLPETTSAAPSVAPPGAP
ncbi:MAG TPA: undecaprenyl-diphosphatase UppP [Anaeromyxobacteraceae bacterium]|nr:undecaprenyl-diphosphatase UppP [Anaeromyxobacteraceae bacterium]